ncbi:hypothetical protein IRZ83_05690 [Flavobacterium sp. JLP]|uniref:hypothetical protein n=1 Tax=Flavobacterium sp. JLP TaxID=2783793 RepID=UPI00188A3A1A|nr:hypothetical protein [Flavobacterium sp. JLP]MBF4506155.1 hypothetical protein [Flavobacterium sp. JLP]
MIKKILLASLFLSSLIAFSQEIVSSTPLELKKNRGVFQTINNEKKEVTLFVSDKIKVNAIHLNEKMQIVDSISTERPNPKVYKNMIGYNVNNDNTRLFWSSDDYEDIFTQLYDFNSQKVVTQQYTLVLKEEKFLQKFSENENFYILTVVKKSNNLKLHIFDKEGVYKEKTFNLDNFHFFKQKFVKTNLYGILEESFLPNEWPFSMHNMNVENPTSLNEATKKRKCYFNKKQLVLTIDTNPKYTQAIVLDLENFTATEKIVTSPSIVDVTESGYPIRVNANSFFIDNKLYQIKSSKEIFYFTIKDLDGNLIKEYSATPDAPIEFKNTEITQKGNDFIGGGEKVLENSSQFIRKITNLHAGVACYRVGENIRITFGGISDTSQQPTGQVVMNQFGLIGALLGAVIFNPTMDSFNSYNIRKVVKVDGLFDKEGNHVKGELQPLAFDKIREFLDKNENTSSQIIFKIDSYYLGYYDAKAKNYIITKFND